MELLRRSSVNQQHPFAAGHVDTLLQQLAAPANNSSDQISTGLSMPVQPTLLNALPLAPAASLLLLIAQFLVVPAVRKLGRSRRFSYQPLSSSASTLVEPSESDEAAEVKGLGYVKRSGGWGVVVFAVLKLLSLVALEVLAVLSAVENKGKAKTVENWSLVAGVGYAVILSILLLTVRPSVISAKTQALKAHLNAILLIIWTIFFVRDILPLGTFPLQPQDDLNALMWVKLSLLTFAAVLVPLLTPRTHVPIGKVFGEYEPTTEQTTPILALITFTYLEPLFWKAWRVPSLPFEDFPPLSDKDEAATIRRSLLHEIDPASKDPRAPKNRRRHLGWRVLKAFDHEIALGLLTAIGYCLAQFLGPFGTNRLLLYLQSEGEGAVVRLWVWILLVAFGPLVQSTFLNLHSWVVCRLAVRGEALLTMALLEHTLRIQPREGAGKVGTTEEEKRKIEANTNVVGRVTNHFSTDLNSIISGRSILMDGIVGPVGIVVSMYALWKLLGKTAFVSMFLMVIQIPVPAKLAVLTKSVQKEFSVATDARVQRISEAINALRLTKLFGLEAQVAKQVQALREKEMLLNRTRKLLSLGLSIVSQVLPLLTMLVTYAWFAAVQKGELTAAIVFSATGVFNVFMMALHRLTNLSSLIESSVALSRLNLFFQDTELLDRFDENSATAISDDPSYIGFHDATFAWLKDVPANSEQRNFKLHLDGDVRFPVGKVSLIAGPTGSGKTSLLMALLGEMHFEPSGPNSSFGLPRSGGVAYASQQSWLQSRTLRENILFGSAFDKERYNQVVKECALERDFQLFEAGDETEVGEKGVTLSGGQKARVTLARAVYSRANVILLDDVLSALDVHTSKFIVDNLFKGSLIKNRTIILVTHHVGLASQVAEFLLTVEDGRVRSQGSISELKRVQSGLFKELEGQDSEAEVAAEMEAVDGPVDAKAEDKMDGKLVQSEEKAIGRSMSFRSLKIYLKTLGGIPFFTFVIGGLVCDCGLITLQTWWLSVWARAYEGGGPVNVWYYIAVYGLMMFVAMVAYGLGAGVWYVGSIKSGIRLHKMLLDSIFAATFRFLDLTPQGRIISRFTSSFSTIDGSLTTTTYNLMEIVVMILIRVFAILTVAPIFGFGALFVGAIGALVAQLYIHAQLSCKRESNNLKSPLFQTFNDSLSGLVSVRAYGGEEAVKQEAEERCDKYFRAAAIAWDTTRWVNNRLDSTASIFTLLVPLYLIYGPIKSDPSTIGFTISLTLSFSNLMLWVFRMGAEWESSATQLERVLLYLDCDKEKAPVPEGIPPAYWPASGSIRAEGLIARYSVDGPVVLKGIDLDITSGERIGVVGRTGSGKSTLALALLRLIPTEGKVFLDDKDTGTINLDALRSKVTIIPQDPTLFSGTLRKNIDPYDEYEDAALVEVLKSSGLSASSEPGTEDGTGTPHHLTLMSEISAGGENLSQGQRQLVSLARGLVRKSKIYLLDEATASVDYATDSLIQHSIRTELQGTLITIAHRLRTICDFDRILVLDAGKVVEFDSPANLLKANGQFAQMVASSPDADELRELAFGRR